MNGPARHCPERSDALLLLLFDELGDAERRELGNHLDQCDGCRQRLDELRQAIASYRSLGLERSADPDAWRQRLQPSEPAAVGHVPDGDERHQRGRESRDEAAGAGPADRWLRRAAGLLLLLGLAATGAWWIRSATSGHGDLEDPGVRLQPLGGTPIPLSAGVLASPEPAPGDRFGTALHAADDWLAVSAPGSGRAGSVYLGSIASDRLVWGARLDAPEGLDGRFGSVLGGDERTLLAAGRDRIGAWHLAILGRTEAGWRLETILEDPTGDPASLFGRAVALDGDRLLVGASRALPEGVDATGAHTADLEPVGAVYEYRRDTAGWQYVGRISPEPLVPNSRFGSSLALDAGRALIGARGEDFSGPVAQPGIAYLFESDGPGRWEQTRTFRGISDDVDFFGSSVALEGDLVAVGAEEEPLGSARPGAVYVFRAVGSDWQMEGRLLPPSSKIDSDRGRTPGLGRSITLDSGTVLVASRGDVRPDEIVGVALYVYARDGGGWELQEILELAETTGAERPVGAPLVVHDLLLLGTPRGPDSPGAVHVWKDAEPIGPGR